MRWARQRNVLSPAWKSFAGLLALASLSCAHTGRYAGSAAETMFRSAVTIKVACLDGTSARGGGVTVGSRTVLTARHVVEACRGEPAMILANDVEVIVDETSEDADVARLLTTGVGEPFAVWATPAGAPALGQQVCTIAGDASVPRVAKCGLVSERGESWVLVGLHTVAGNSGAPVFDAEGQLVGILTSHAGSWTEDAAVVVTRPGWHRLVASSRQPVVRLDGPWP